jgi:transposase
MLKRHAAPAEVTTLPEKQFIRQVQAEMPRRRLAVGKLRQAHALAAESVGVRETEALQLSIRFYVERLALLAGQMTMVKSCLKETLIALPEAPYMLSLGLGIHTTAIILGEIGDPRRYRRGDQLVKLAGVQPTPNVSGQKRNSKTPMSRKGRPRLRSTLYFACLRLVKQDPGFKQLYQRLQTRRHNSLEKMEAIGVLMSKVLRVMWALIRQQTFYDSERLLLA